MFASAPVLAHILPLRQRDFKPPASRVPHATTLRIVGRTNVAAATLIEQGIAFANHRTQNQVVDFLCAQGISLRTIARVLFKPELRRASRCSGIDPREAL